MESQVLLPPTIAADIQAGIGDYLATTFALTDAATRNALERFLDHEETGMFKGPYVRTRLPFAPGSRENLPLDFYPSPHAPYGHQLAAYHRLSTKPKGTERFARPQPTLVTTGTGSGKTEAFLHPILDHVLRAKKAGITGIKALILYPMNALANDQSARLDGLLVTYPELTGVRVGLYTGEHGEGTKFASKHFTTDRYEMRQNPPDILLTNYKMLDMLLLRSEDAGLWQKSATSLTYLVLDEFHSYDGAQGTDVAMLLRRLAATLTSHWPADLTGLAQPFTEADRGAPLGGMTPVATSATMGSGQSASSRMLDFASRVFGVPFTEKSVITESRLTPAQWALPASPNAREIEYIRADVPATAKLLGRHLDHAQRLAVLLPLLFENGEPMVGWGEADLLDALRAHPLIVQLAEQSQSAIALTALASSLLARESRPSPAATTVLTHLLSLLAHVRAVAGLSGLGVESHLWIREPSRIDAKVNQATEFRWSDDVPTDEDDDAAYLPAIYCRQCGRSGWAAQLSATGIDLEFAAGAIRTASYKRDSSIRFLILATGEANSASHRVNLRYFDARSRRLLSVPSGEDEQFPAVPVLVHVGTDAGEEAAASNCPACEGQDTIRFMGSAIATLTSVAISNVFGHHAIDVADKKALVFTDSVQDAAHRAGFIQSRSHSFNLRTSLRAAFNEDGETITLDQLIDAVFATARAGDANQRFAVLPPDLAYRQGIVEFWQGPGNNRTFATAAKKIKHRLAFDAIREFGIDSAFGRTLEATGTITVEVDAGSSEALARIAKSAYDKRFDQIEGTGPRPAALVAWVRGILQRLRRRGGIYHQWLEGYIRSGGDGWYVNGGRKRSEGMPGMRYSRSVPRFVAFGKQKTDTRFDKADTRTSWYVQWTKRCLEVSSDHAPQLLRFLCMALEEEGVLREHSTKQGGTVYSINQDRVLLSSTTDEELEGGALNLECDICKATNVLPGAVAAQLKGAPCMSSGCDGHLQPTRGDAHNYYRNFYRSPYPKRVVSREHSSLLPTKTRLEYETGFKQNPPAPGAPNVLVATPTLEMGIDIGDLSYVVLASMPTSVASYVQRVGRAGRRTGNSLILALVQGRGEHLPKIYDPLSIINGEVEPPSTYLEATEILQRQFAAFVGDRLARLGQVPEQTRQHNVLKSADPDTYLGKLIELVEQNGDALIADFTSRLAPYLGESSIEALALWARHSLRTDIEKMVHTWNQDRAQLRFKLAAMQKGIKQLEAERDKIRSVHGFKPTDALEKLSDLPADLREAERELRSAVAQTARMRAKLGEDWSSHWISMLESAGLFPNYTLLDDTVTLNVEVTRRNPETTEFEADTKPFTRGASSALMELAPGAAFYADGLEIKIDAIDLGENASRVERWQICPCCGWHAEVSSGPASASGRVSTCARCGDGAIADSGQNMDVVRLQTVSARVFQDESAITDKSDERRRSYFSVIPLPDLDRRYSQAQWFESSTGFGIEYLSRADITWLNLGATSSGAAERTLGGHVVRTPLFRVCSYCGKLDGSVKENSKEEHRYWCKHRLDIEEHNATIAISRHLRTQGVVLHLPSAAAVSEEFAIPTLKAAILLGMQKQIGGTIGTLSIISLPNTKENGPNSILIHDQVPGGTGYLAAFKEPRLVHDALAAAWEVVTTCSCAEEARRACHRCLLPFADHGQVANVSRVDAQRLLGILLGIGPASPRPDFARWGISTSRPESTATESALELRMRALLKQMLEKAGAQMTEVPGLEGPKLIFSLPGSDLKWSLSPQVLLGGTKPDFVLACTNPRIPRLAIYTDGAAFHASSAHNRAGDDAIKRHHLRVDASPSIPWALTDQDLDLFEAQLRDKPLPSAGASEINPQVLDFFSAQYVLPAPITAALSRGSMALLWEWIVDPDVEKWTAFSTIAPSLALVSQYPLDQQTAHNELGVAEPTFNFIKSGLSKGEQGKWWERREGTMRLIAGGIPSREAATRTIRSLVYLDDSAPAAADYQDSWRAWLYWANLTAFASPRVNRVLTASSPDVLDDLDSLGASSLPADVPPAWQEILDDAVDDQERSALLQIVAVPGVAKLELPSFGEEIGGTPVLLRWPEYGYAIAYSEDDLPTLTASGLTAHALTQIDQITAKLVQLSGGN